MLGEARLVEIPGDDSRARGKGGFDVVFNFKAFGEGFFSHQTCCDHDVRIGSICAGGDSGKDH